jgi:hypothetical protein
MAGRTLLHTGIEAIQISVIGASGHPEAKRECGEELSLMPQLPPQL